MERGYQKIFWGLIFVTFHLEFGFLKMLPPFIGWMILISGVHEIDSKFQNSSISTESFLRALTYGRILVVLTLIDAMGTLVTGGTMMEHPVFLYYPIIVIMFEAITFFFILEGTHKVFSELSFEEKKEETKTKLRTYLVMVLLSTGILTFTLFFNHTVSMVIGVLLGIIAVIYLLVFFSQLKKFWGQDPLVKPIDDGRTVAAS